MRPAKKLTMPVFALIAGFAGGFALARSPCTVPTRPEPRSAAAPAAGSTPAAASPAFEAPAADLARSATGDRAGPDTRPALAADFERIAHLGGDGERRRMLDRLLQKGVIEDAPATAGFVLGIQNEDARKESLLRLMQTWAVQDPDAALTWAAEAAFDNDYERSVSMAMACTQVAHADPPEALRLALKYKVEDLTDGLCQGLTARWAEIDLSAARDWVFSLPPGPQRDRFVESVALVVFDQGPAKAAQVILDQIPDGESQDRALLAIVDRLALQNPARAQAWVTSFPEGALRDRAMNTLDGILDHQTTNE